MLDKVKEQLNKPKSIQVYDGYWSDSIIGLALVAAVPASVVLVLIFGDDVNFSRSWGAITILCVTSILTIIFVYYLITERRFKKTITNLTKGKNKKLLKKVLDNIGWNYSSSVDIFEISISKSQYNPFCNLQFQAITLDKEILYNIIYKSGRGGRTPFSLGFKTYATWKFLRAIKRHITQNAL